MEKILDENERLRRAEEIYLKRNNRTVNLYRESGNKEKRYIGSKILLYLIIMFDIAVMVFCLQNREYIFTEDFLNQCSQYNMNITEKINELVEEFLVDDSIIENTVQNNTDKIVFSENIVNETNEQTIISNQENISVVEIKNEESTITEMETDVENLKKIYKFVKPLDAIISSEFGARESKYQNVTGYHTGIDLAAEKGTSIKAAMQGIVTLVSDEGDYGKHIKIRCNNVTTLYAHCSEILVKEGQIVAEGQEIGRVGSTGNSTGNHLHFEIRIDDRFVDPGMVIDFN